MIEGKCFAKEHEISFLKTEGVSAEKINDFLRKNGAYDVVAIYQPKFEQVELFCDSNGENYHLSGNILDKSQVLLASHDTATVWLACGKRFNDYYKIMDGKR